MAPVMDLPGFYFDASKNRYFPLSSRPQARESDDGQSLPQIPRKVSRNTRNFDVSAPAERRWLGGTWCQKERKCHEIVSSHVQASSRAQDFAVNTFGSVTAFCMTNSFNATRGFMGDDRGWVYTYSSDDENPDDEIVPCWSPELNLQNACEISSISVSGTRCVATSHGNLCKILVQDMNSSETFLLNIGKNIVHDVWTSQLQDRNLVLGGNLKAVFLRDIDASRSVLTLDTKSDVFAVHQNQNSVYTGSRNGVIACFDLRVDKPRGFKLFDSRFHPSCPRSSVTYLNIIRGHELLVNHINGNMEAYDLRFPRSSSPFLSFTGHVNSYTQKLGVAIDPYEEFIFAAGQDGRIRAWSLRTGDPLHPPSNSPWLSPPHLEGAPLPVSSSQKPISLLQITEGRDGLLLWSLSGDRLQKCWIGHI